MDVDSNRADRRVQTQRKQRRQYGTRILVCAAHLDDKAVTQPSLPSRLTASREDACHIVIRIAGRIFALRKEERESRFVVVVEYQGPEAGELRIYVIAIILVPVFTMD